MTIFELLKTYGTEIQVYQKNWPKGNYLRISKTYDLQLWDNESFQWTKPFVLSLKDLISKEWFVLK